MLSAILKAMTKKEYCMLTRPFELNIVGIRSQYFLTNSFNDYLTVSYTREDGNWLFNCFSATTDPGTFWLKKPMNPAGTAILKPGQYKEAYQLGLHRGKYKALIQKNAVTVIRDNNHDEQIDITAGKEDKGIFGINIHRAEEKGTTKTISKYSAGCQVLANANDFTLLIQLAERHRKLYGNSFTYTLLEERDMMLS